MNILKNFVPDEELNSFRELKPEELKKNGIRGIVFDIDNTLVPHGAPATEEAKLFMKGLREQGFTVCLISNNHEERVRPFAEEVSAFSVWEAKKPLKKAYEKALAVLKMKPRETAFVGDQLFTDVWGAKRSHLYSFLVKPLDPSTDPPFVRLKRILEKPIFYYIMRKKG